MQNTIENRNKPFIPRKYLFLYMVVVVRVKTTKSSKTGASKVGLQSCTYQVLFVTRTLTPHI